MPFKVFIMPYWKPSYIARCHGVTIDYANNPQSAGDSCRHTAMAIRIFQTYSHCQKPVSTGQNLYLKSLYIHKITWVYHVLFKIKIFHCTTL